LPGLCYNIGCCPRRGCGPNARCKDAVLIKHCCRYHRRHRGSRCYLESALIYGQPVDTSATALRQKVTTQGSVLRKTGLGTNPGRLLFILSHSDFAWHSAGRVP
jgi:hypothetical protein